MKIGIAIWSITYGKGGSERASCALANHLVMRGHEVVVFHNDADGAYSPYPVYFLLTKVRMRNLRLTDRSGAHARARQMIVDEGLDVLLIFSSDNVLLWFPKLLHNTGVPAIYTERSAPHRVRTLTWNAMEHAACVCAMDHVVLLMSGFKAAYPEYMQPRISVIPNAVVIPSRAASPEGLAGRPKTLLTVARFVELKQLPLLFTAFAGIADAFPDWRLRLCGGGREEREYRLLVEALGIADQVDFAGIVEDMEPEYAAAQLFCLPSRFEGCSNAILEAQAAGLPSVGFAQAPGVNELIVSGENGLLVPEMTAESLAQTLFLLMSKPGLRRALGENARQGAECFAPDTIFGEWESLLEEVAKCKGKTRLTGELPATPEAKAQAVLQTILLRSKMLSPFEE